MLPTVDIIIVNWNSGKQLCNCLQSIAATIKEHWRLGKVIIIDNASSDSSLKGLDNIEFPLYLIRNNTNLGFAAACNQGAKECKADYILFLNPDTMLFENSLSVPLEFMERPENRDIGIVGIQLLDENGHVSKTCARFPTPGQFFAKMLGLDRLFPNIFHSHFMVEWDHMNSREIDHVIGAFFLVRRSIFEELNGFDERFFVYLEDLDFSLRARERGWKTFYLADAQAYHKGGGTSEQVKAKRLFYSLRSRILYSYKHFSWLSATLLLLGTMIIEPLSRMALCIVRRSGSDVIETCKAYFMLWSSMPEWIRMAMKK